MRMPVSGGPTAADIVDFVGQFLSESEELDTLGAVLHVAQVATIFRKRHPTPA